MEIQIAVAKVSKYAVTESGDTLEVVERPGGGLSVVLADGQSSGRGAKAISQLVVRKVIGLLAEGVRDGAAARAASDALFTDKQGKVISTLNIASLDLSSGTLVLTRNNPAPVFVCRGETIDVIEEESVPLGISRNVRPLITEIAIEPGLIIVIYTDGLTHAGKRRGIPMDVGSTIRSVLDDQDPSPQLLADTLLAQAVRLDDERPADDISVLVLKVTSRIGDNVRRMTVRLPIDGIARLS
jgi:serine phosphatase RsbU (regulator of sigma subunit)